jgi:outer membrane immunogenic protein
MIVMSQRPVRLVLFLLTLTVSITAYAQDPKELKDAKDSQSSFNWTGLYLGGNGGFNFSHYDIAPSDDAFPYTVPVFGLSKTEEGFFGGGQIGYNYQLGHFVLGLEGDFDGASSHHATTKLVDVLNPPLPDTVRTERSAELDWNASARLRGGLALGNFLFYATGGGAFAHLNVHAKDTLGSIFTHTAVSSIDDGNDKTAVGWTAGAGADWAVTKWLSVGLEYRHSGFGTDSYGFASGPRLAPGATKIGFDEDQVTLRVNLLISGLMGR